VHFQPVNNGSMKHNNLTSSTKYTITTLAQFLSKQKRNVYSSD